MPPQPTLAPHVSYTVTQLVAVTSLKGWSNLKVKVIGVLCNIDIDKKRVALHEVGQPHHPVFIMVSKFFTFTVSSNAEKELEVPVFLFPS